MLPELEAQLEQILDSIVSSEAPRKVIDAGPGTGKTTLFRRLLQATIAVFATIRDLPPVRRMNERRPVFDNGGHVALRFRVPNDCSRA